MKVRTILNKPTFLHYRVASCGDTLQEVLRDLLVFWWSVRKRLDEVDAGIGPLQALVEALEAERHVCSALAASE
jgi:hypothetical protein